MTGIATKVKMGTAAGALVLATVLTPAGVAQADPVAPVPQAGIGNSVDCDPAETPCAADLRFAPNFSASLIGPPPNIIQNDIWWFGPANPNPPPRATVFTFQPLALIPGFLRPLYGFFTQNLNFEVCFGGFSVQVGPYGSVSGTVGRHC